ncbi:MAG TPA: hypothetical protein VFB46_08600 [Gemmatimonadaceae bacterium]|nr:hypothetical protein [Gemmatimonadaceae bacterium]
MSHRLTGAAALVLGVALAAATPLAAQQAADSGSDPHVMAAVVVNGSRNHTRRPSAAENARLERDLARYDARIVALELHLDSLKTKAELLERGRASLEAAAAETRHRRLELEQRLRELESGRSP